MALATLVGTLAFRFEKRLERQQIRVTGAGDVDFWNVAQRLAEAGHIAPLATRGIIGQVTPAAVVYDAETTSGGSGGPVINLQGEVIAVNMAILPEFGGSNLGVPIDKAREILPTPEDTAEDAETEAADTAYSPVADYPVP
ncbi:MAG: hypothetical protein GY719_25660 [bacterium]|nr:hypothetical protein [bacterium]